jgi:hypothetical protein
MSVYLFHEHDLRYLSSILVSATTSLGGRLAENVLNWAEIVRHGARNWVCANCARHDMPSGE